MRSLVIILLAFTSISIVKGGSDPQKIENFCDKFPKERCDQSPGVRKQCPKLCGQDNPPGHEEPADVHDTTKKPSVTTASKPAAGGKKGCDKRSDCIPLGDANNNFRKRCEAQGPALKDTCYEHCRYDETTAQMKHDFLSGPCPLPQLRQYLTAASNGKDNTQCCADTGVLAQKKTGVCGVFCNPTGPVWPAKGEAAKYAPCVNVLEGIMQCHRFAEGAD